LSAGIESLILQSGALGILGYVVYYQMTHTNSALQKLKGVIEKNTLVIEYCFKERDEAKN
jgi:hypothetical protein